MTSPLSWLDIFLTSSVLNTGRHFHNAAVVAVMALSCPRTEQTTGRTSPRPLYRQIFFKTFFALSSCRHVYATRPPCDNLVFPDRKIVRTTPQSHAIVVAYRFTPSEKTPSVAVSSPRSGGKNVASNRPAASSEITSGGDAVENAVRSAALRVRLARGEILARVFDDDGTASSSNTRVTLPSGVIRSCYSWWW